MKIKKLDFKKVFTADDMIAWQANRYRIHFYFEEDGPMGELAGKYCVHSEYLPQNFNTLKEAKDFCQEDWNKYVRSLLEEPTYEEIKMTGCYTMEKMLVDAEEALREKLSLWESDDYLSGGTIVLKINAIAYCNNKEIQSRRERVRKIFSNIETEEDE